MKYPTILLSLSALLASGCAKNTDEISASYASPMTYQDYSCSQLSAEITRISRRASELTHSINKNAQSDAIAMGVGLVLLWPALFFIDGDTPEAQEYARLKGEYEAIEKVTVQKSCGTIPQSNPFTEAEKTYRNNQQQNNVLPSQRKKSRALRQAAREFRQARPKRAESTVLSQEQT